MWHGIITKVNSAAKSLKLHSIFPAFLAKDKHKPLPFVFNRNWTIIFVCQIMELIDYVFGKKALLIKDIIKKVKGTQASYHSFKYGLATLKSHFSRAYDSVTLWKMAWWWNRAFCMFTGKYFTKHPFSKKNYVCQFHFCNSLSTLQCFNVLTIMLSKVGFSSYNLI